jgi:hypothetical protein
VEGSKEKCNSRNHKKKHRENSERKTAIKKRGENRVEGKKQSCKISQIQCCYPETKF